MMTVMMLVLLIMLVLDGYYRDHADDYSGRVGNDTVRADGEGCDEDGGDENSSFDDDDGEDNDNTDDDDHDVAYELGAGTDEINNVMVLVATTRTAL